VRLSECGFQLSKLQSFVDLRYAQAISTVEAKRRIALDHRVPVLVQQTMVMTADADEFIKARLAAIGPVLDVVTVDGRRE